MDDCTASELLTIMDRLGWDHGGLSTAAADRAQVQAEAQELLSSMLEGAAHIAFLLTVDDDSDCTECTSVLTPDERSAFDAIVALDELI